MSVDYRNGPYLCAPTVRPATVDLFKLGAGDDKRHIGSMTAGTRKNHDQFECDCKFIVDAFAARDQATST